MIDNAPALLFGLAAAITGCHRAAPLPEGLQGVVEYDDRVVGFEVPGRVQSVAVRRGDVVADGAPLAQLDDTLERLTCETRRDDVKTARADLALILAGTRREEVTAAAEDLNGALAAESLARTQEERTRALFDKGALPKAEVDRADADLDRAVAARKSLEERLAALKHGARPEEIARAKARLDEAASALALEEERLARYALRSEGAGEVLDVTVEPGELAAVGTLAVTLADTAHPFVDVFVAEGEMDGVRIGAKAEVRIDAPGAPFPGVVEYVSKETEFTPKFLFSPRERPNLVVRVRVRVDDPARRMHAGVPAFAKILR